jgi:sn-glycerol 3-phosphate transport system substrate-binding protein
MLKCALWLYCACSLLCATPFAVPAEPLPPVQEIIFWHSMAGQLGEEVTRLTQAFNQSQTAFKVKPIYKGNYLESLTSFAAAFRAKHQPNLIQVAEVGMSVMLRPNGVIKPVQQLMQEQGKDFSSSQFFPAIREQYSVNGVLMAMPFNVSVPVLYYNADVLKKLGVTAKTFPKTWDEFEILAKRIHQAGFHCSYTTAYPAWVLIESYQALNGTSGQLNALSKHIHRMRRWQGLQYFEYGGRGDDATVLFTSGRCPMFSQSAGAYAALARLLPFHVGVASMPFDPIDNQPRQNNVVGGAAIWVISGQSSRLEQGIAAFLAFISQKDIQQSWYERTGYLPLNEATFDQVANEVSSNMIEIAKFNLNNGQAYLSRTKLGAENQLRTIYDRMLEAIFSGIDNPDTAMNQVRIRTQHALLRFGNNVGSIL